MIFCLLFDNWRKALSTMPWPRCLFHTAPSHPLIPLKYLLWKDPYALMFQNLSQFIFELDCKPPKDRECIFTVHCNPNNSHDRCLDYICAVDLTWFLLNFYFLYLLLLSHLWLCCVQLFAISWAATCPAPLSFTVS